MNTSSNTPLLLTCNGYNPYDSISTQVAKRILECIKNEEEYPHKITLEKIQTEFLPEHLTTATQDINKKNIDYSEVIEYILASSQKESFKMQKYAQIRNDLIQDIKGCITQIDLHRKNIPEIYKNMEKLILLTRNFLVQEVRITKIPKMSMDLSGTKNLHTSQLSEDMLQDFQMTPEEYKGWELLDSFMYSLFLEGFHCNMNTSQLNEEQAERKVISLISDTYNKARVRKYLALYGFIQAQQSGRKIDLKQVTTLAQHIQDFERKKWETENQYHSLAIVPPKKNKIQKILEARHASPRASLMWEDFAQKMIKCVQKYSFHDIEDQYPVLQMFLEGNGISIELSKEDFSAIIHQEINLIIPELRADMSHHRRLISDVCNLLARRVGYYHDQLSSALEEYISSYSTPSENICHNGKKTIEQLTLLQEDICNLQNTFQSK